MEGERRYRGRTVTAGEVSFIRELIAAHPQASRYELSRRLCEAWNWKQANVVTGHLNEAAWSLWLANLLFAANQIQFVQLRIRAAHVMKPIEKLSIGRAFLVGQIVLVVLLCLTGADHLFGWYAAMAFLPVLFRGFAWFVSESEPLAIHILGKRELMHAVVFGVLLVLGFQQP